MQPFFTSMNNSSLGLSLSLMVSLCNPIQQIEFYCYLLLFFPPPFSQNHNPVFQSLFSRFFPSLSPKDTTASGSKTWQWFGFSKAMSHAGLFSPQWASEWSTCPHMCLVGPALPTLLIAGDVLDSVQLTSKETRYIIVRRGTTGDQTEDGFVEPPNPSTKRFGHKRLSCLAWSQSMGFSHYNWETGNAGHASRTSTRALAAASWMAVRAPHNPQLPRFFLRLAN